MKRLMVLVFLAALVFNFKAVIAGDEPGHSHNGEKQTLALENQGLGVCSVKGELAVKDFSYTYKGKTYYFCCSMCIEEFKKDPEKYISKIKEASLEAYQYGFSPDPLVVKKGDIVKLVISSRDVAHGVYIKEYGINVSVKKGENKEVEFIADKAGQFDIICSVYCGTGHSRMRGRLLVEE